MEAGHEYARGAHRRRAGAAAHGFVPRIPENGKHIKLRWFDAGRRYTLVISRTPSDNYARQNSRATLKRILRNANGTTP
jgi:hypothetical protein